MMSSKERDDDREFIASESKASSHHIYTCDTQSTRLNKKSKHDSKTLPLFLTIKYFLIDLLLPEGYPNSVSTDYLTYQFWDSCQELCSSIMITLATYAVLKGYGVGNGSASVIAATLNWMLKDGTGMLGRILFAYIQGTKMDSDCKRWRLFADIANDLSFGIDLVSPLVSPALFLPCQCIASLSRALVGVAAGAAGNALRLHHAKAKNFGDIAAKDNNQRTLIKLIGLSLSLLLTPMISKSQSIVWSLCVFLISGHLYSNYKAVTSSMLNTFNLNRLGVVVDHYFRTGEILSVREANLQENVFFFIWTKYDTLYQSKPIDTHVDSGARLTDLIEIYSNADYILNVDHREKIYINFSSKADFDTYVRASFHALLVEFCKSSSNVSVFDDVNNLQNMYLQNDCEKMLIESLVVVDNHFNVFKAKAIQNQWNMSRNLITTSQWIYKKSE